jgi:hypothetical protein
MTRRVTLPGADELFRATGTGGPDTAAVDVVAPRPLSVAPGLGSGAEEADGPTAVVAAEAPPSRRRASTVRRTTRPRPRSGPERQPSGRERHEEKITVYLSPDELVDLEHARLTLRQDHGMAVDRGRIVREALAVVLADLDGRGDSSTLVRRLRDA